MRDAKLTQGTYLSIPLPDVLISGVQEYATTKCFPFLSDWLDVVSETEKMSNE